MNIFPVKDMVSYQKAVDRIDQLADSAQPGTTEYDELDVLSTLVESFEEEEFPIESDPIEVIRLKMAYMNISQKDLVGIIGSKGYISKLLNYKKPISLEAVRQFSDFLNISPSTLINPYPVDWQTKYMDIYRFINIRSNLLHYKLEIKPDKMTICNFHKNGTISIFRDCILLEGTNGIEKTKIQESRELLETAREHGIVSNSFISQFEEFKKQQLPGMES